MWEELGLSSSNGMGNVPLSFMEIEAYSSILVGYLREFEVKAIRNMSVRYCRGLSLGKEKGAFPPYTESNEDTSSRLKDAMSILQKK